MLSKIVKPVEVKPDTDSKKASKKVKLYILRYKGIVSTKGIKIYPKKTVKIFSNILGFFSGNFTL